MALSPTALTDYASVALRLGLSGTADQALIEAFIGEASDALETFCGRAFTYQPDHADTLPAMGGPKLLVERTPVYAMASVVVGGVTVDPSEYALQDAQAGIIYRRGGWPWTARFRGDLNFTNDKQPGSEEAEVVATYPGGFITPAQAYGAAGWPGAAQAVALGALLKDPNGGLWMGIAAGVTGGTQPTWANPPAARARITQVGIASGSTQTDGSVTWMYLGTAGSAGARGTAPTLPADLERACFLTVAAAYRERKDNPNTTSESVLGVSMSVERVDLPPGAQALALRYARA